MPLKTKGKETPILMAKMEKSHLAINRVKPVERCMENWIYFDLENLSPE